MGDVAQRVREEYPMFAFLLGDKEVGALLRDAVDPNSPFSPTTFQAKLMQTHWYKSRSASARQYEILRHSDPAEFKRRQTQIGSELRQKIAGLGFSMTPKEQAFMASYAMLSGNDISDSAVLMNMRQFMLNAPAIRFYSGTARGAMQQVRNMAVGEYVIPPSGASFGGKVGRQLGVDLALGLIDEAAVREKMQQEAIKRYPWLADQIRQGKTPREIINGQISAYADELEVSPDQVSLGSMKRFLSKYDSSTKSYRPMTTAEAVVDARSQDRYWKTSGGRQRDANMTNALLRMFGKRA